MHELLVLPISGGSFHVQLFIIIQLIRAGCKKPNLILGNSGGSINSYVVLYSKWEVDKIKKLLREVDSTVYSSSWWYSPLDKIIPSYIAGFFKGSLYNNGIGFNRLFKEIFTEDSIGDIEIWSMKVNYKTMKGKLSCNRDKSILDFTNYNYEVNKIECITYNSFDIDKIANDCISSCSIPLMVPSKRDGDDYYIDGGMLYASPLTPLYYEVDKLDEELHLLYISPSNIQDETTNNEYSNIINNTKCTIDHIMLGPSISDRSNAIKLVGTNPKFREGKCDKYVLKHILTKRYKYKRTLLELYPLEEIKLNINNFKMEDINRDYKHFSNVGYGYRLWYV